MALPPPDGSPHTHRPSIVLAVAVQRDGCLAAGGINCSQRKDQTLQTGPGVLGSGGKYSEGGSERGMDPRIREVDGQENQS